MRALSGLVRARGLKHSYQLKQLLSAVRARKSPWIETYLYVEKDEEHYVRARKSPWIETNIRDPRHQLFLVRARKSPWIETNGMERKPELEKSGLVRARGLKLC